MIDIMLFYKSRFFRLWPALLVYELVNIVVWLIYTAGVSGPRSYENTWKDVVLWSLKELFFINNLPIGKFVLTHIWSVAVEF